MEVEPRVERFCSDGLSSYLWNPATVALCSTSNDYAFALGGEVDPELDAGDLLKNRNFAFLYNVRGNV